MQEERRRSKRTKMSSSLVIKKVGNEEETTEVSIEISDVSKTGIGFTCKEALQIGEVYESYLTIWTKEVFHAFIQVARIEMMEDGYSYGGMFIGMPEADLARIEVYQTVNDSEE